MREATGAVRVVAFDHITRNAALSAKGNQIKQPATRVHNDYTDWSAPQRVRDLMGGEAEEAPLRDQQCVAADPRAALAIAAGIMRRIEPL